MAWYKRGYFKKAYKAGAKRYSKGGKFSSTRLVKDVAMLKSLINAEKKFMDYNLTPTISSTASYNHINGCAQDDTETGRDGQSVKMVSLYVEGYVTLNASATQDNVRISVVLDRQVNGSGPAYTDIYESSNPASFRNKDTVDRFQVLKSQNIILSHNGANLKKFCFYINLGKFDQKDMHVKYNGALATLASIYTNALYITWVGTQATNTSTAVINSRIRFVDN